MLKKILLALAAPFAWRRVKMGVGYEGNIWAYRENRATGDRIAIRSRAGGYQPVAWLWLYEAPRWKVIDDQGNVINRGIGIAPRPRTRAPRPAR